MPRSLTGTLCTLLSALALSALLFGSASGDQISVKDRLGVVRSVPVPEKPANVLFDVASGDTTPVAGYKPLLFDVEFLTGASTSGSQVNESAFLGASVKWIATNWLKFGPQFEWVNQEQKLADFSVPITFYLLTNLFASVVPIVDVNPVHFTTNLDGDPLQGHFSLQIDPKFGLEIPQGSIAFQIYTGPEFVFKYLSENQDQLTPSWNMAAKIILRPRPPHRPVP